MKHKLEIAKKANETIMSLKGFAKILVEKKIVDESEIKGLI